MTKKVTEVNHENCSYLPVLALLKEISDRQTVISEKVDAITSSMSDWKVKCVECRNDIDKEIQPLREKFLEDISDNTIPKKIIKMLKSPVFIITVAIYVILASINITTALNTGSLARGINSRLTNIENNTNNYITVDSLKSDLIKIKNLINGN